MTKQINYSIGFQYKDETLNRIMSDLQKMQQMTTLEFKAENPHLNTRQALDQVRELHQGAKELEQAFSKAFNPDLKSINVATLNKELKKLDIDKIYHSFMKAGSEGRAAFRGIATDAITTNKAIKTTNKLLDKMAITMGNTIRFGISSSVWNNLTGSLERAWSYTKNLDKSLNDIRIVSGKTAANMEEFAVQANRAAKALGTSTKEYADASLIYFQQGLSQDEVNARTEITMKLANVTGESAQQVSDYMTAVWNNFNDGSKSLEYYADVMAALGAATASSTEEIAAGLEKFAAIADTVGLSYEYAAAALATVTAETRQSADVVGTAFKTIFARMQDLELGKTLEDGTTLGAYSEALEKVGINIKDSSGQLKDMDDILEEMADKWKVISKDQQVALAQAVAGVRQYNQLIALMDEWDTFEINLKTVNTSEGFVDKGQAKYLESTEAAMAELESSTQRLIDAFIDTDSVNGFIKTLSDGVTVIANMVEGIGGGSNALLMLGGIATQVFDDQISKGIGDAILNFKRMQQEASRTADEMSGIFLDSSIASMKTDPVLQPVFEFRKELASLEPFLNEEQITQFKTKIKELSAYSSTLIGKNIEDVDNAILEMTHVSKKVLEEGLRRGLESKYGPDEFAMIEEEFAETPFDVMDETSLQEFLQKVFSENLKNLDGARFFGEGIQAFFKKETEKVILTINQNIKDMRTKLGKNVIDEKTVKTDKQVKELLQSNIDTIKDTLVNYRDTMREILSDGEINAINDFLDNLFMPGNVAVSASNKDSFGQLTNRFQGQAVTFVKSLNKTADKGSVTMNQFLKIFDDLDKGVRKGIDLEDAKEEVQKILKALDVELEPARTAKKAKAFVDFSSSIAQLTSGFQALVNVASIWNNQDLSTTEKLWQTFVALSTAIPVLINGFKLLRESFKPSLQNILGGLDKIGKSILGIFQKKTQEDYNKELDKTNKKLQEKVALEQLSAAINSTNPGSPGPQTEGASNVKVNPSAIGGLAKGGKLMKGAQITAGAGSTAGAAGGAGAGAAGGAGGAALSAGAIATAAAAILAILLVAAVVIAAVMFAIDQYTKSLLAEADAANAALKEQKELSEEIRATTEETRKLVDQTQELTDQWRVGKLATEEYRRSVLELLKSYQDASLYAQALTADVADLQDIIEQAAIEQEQALIEQEEATQEAADKAIAANMDVAVKTNQSYKHRMDGFGAEIDLEGMVWRNDEEKEFAKALEDLGVKFNAKDKIQIDSLTDALSADQQAVMDVLERYSNTDAAKQILTYLQDGKVSESLQALAESEEAQKEAQKRELALTTMATGSYSTYYAEGGDKVIEDVQGDVISYLTHGFHADLFTEDGIVRTEEANDKIIKGISEEQTKFTEAAIAALPMTAAAIINSHPATSIIGKKEEVQETGTKMSSAILKKGESFTYGWEVQGAYKRLEEFSNLFGDEADKILADLYTATSPEKLQEKIEEHSQKLGRSKITGFETYLKAIDAMVNEAMAKELFDNREDAETWARQEMAKDTRYAGYESKNLALEGFYENTNIGSVFERSSKVVIGGMQDLAQNPANLLEMSNDERKDYLLQRAHNLQQLNDKYKNNADIFQDQMMQFDTASIAGLTANFDAVDDEGNKIIDWDELLYGGLTEEEIREKMKNYAKMFYDTGVAINEALTQNQDMIENAGFDVEEVGGYAEYLMKLAEADEDLADSMSQDGDAAVKVATNVNRLNRGIENLNEGWEEWGDILKKSDRDSKEFYDALESTKDALGDILSLEEETEDFIDADFIADNFNLITKAAEGNADAIDDLKEKLSNKILIDVAGEEKFNSLKDEIDKILQADTTIDIGANIDINDDFDPIGPDSLIDEQGFLEACQGIVNTAGMTADEATAYFNALGYEPVFETEEDTISQKIPIEERTDEIVSEETTPDGHKLIKTRTSTNIVGYDDVDQTILVPKIGPDGRPKIVNMRKTAPTGGMSNHSAKNNGGKKLGKSSGSSKQKKDPQKDELNRYQKVDSQLDKIGNTLDKLEDKRDKLTGQKLFDNLFKQFDTLNDKIDVTKDKLAIAIDEMNEYKQELAKDYGIKFGEDGIIQNYKEQYYKELNALNAAIDKYSASDKDADQEKLDKAQERYDKYNDLIKKYDDLIGSFIPGLEADVRDAIDKQIELKVETFKYELDLKLNIKDAKLGWNEFKKTILDGIEETDILGNTQAKLKDVEVYFEGVERNILETNTNKINDLLTDLRKMDEGLDGKIYKDERQQAMDDLKEYYEAAMSNLTEIHSLSEEIHNSYMEMMDEAQEKFNEQIEAYSTISDLIEHDKNIITMIYGEESYSALSKFYDKQESNNNKQIDFQKQQVEFWANQMTLVEEGSEEWDKAKASWFAAVSEWNSAVESAIQNLQDKYLNAINEIFQKLNNEVTGGLGLGYVIEEWSLVNKNAEEYLDSVNAIYGVQQLQSKYLDAIEQNDSSVQQKKLNDLMEQEMGYLREQDKLSQYDLDRANLKYEIALKQIALEEAQQNKTQLRLRRDSQGNYSYQYTADDDQVSSIQQEISDLYNQLYNLDAEEYRGNLESLYDVWVEFQEKMAEAAQINDPEQRAERELLIKEQYGELINTLAEKNELVQVNLNQSTMSHLFDLYDQNIENYDMMTAEQQAILDQFMTTETDFTNAAFDNLFNLYNLTVENFKGMSSEQQDILMGEIVPQWETAVQAMADKIIGEGGFFPVCAEAFSQLAEATESYETSLKTLQETAGTSFEEVKEGIDPVIESTELLLKDNNDLITSYENELQAVQDVIDKLDALKDKYSEVIEKTKEATEAAAKYWMDASNTDAEADPSKVLDEEFGTETDVTTDLNQPGTDNTPQESVKPSLEKGSYVEVKAGTKWYANSYGGGASGRAKSGTIKYINTKGSHAYNINGAGWIKKTDIVGYATGGYTGDWAGGDGRLAMLHQKELVLNANDTKNMLSAIEIVREITSNLGTMLMSRMANIGAIATQGANSGELEQNVHITAEFPNVTSSREIEEALNNLTNKASQYIQKN